MLTGQICALLRPWLSFASVARPRHRLQAIRAPDAHTVALRRLFHGADILRAYVGVAFARAAGVNLVSAALQRLGTRASVFVGIRNDITSAQALLRLHQLGVALYIVDTGRNTEIFHPKIYASIRQNEATVLVGSPNLTAGGLEGNIEASTALDLDLNDPVDAAYVEDLEAAFALLRDGFPNNVIRISTARQVTELLRQGRVADETVRPLPATTTATGTAARNQREMVPRMQLARRQQVPKPRPQPTRRLRIRGRTGFVLAWESDELSERDLNIPSGKTTHATGSMTLRKGRTPDIDQRHYFRDDLFRGLQWKRDPGATTRETATAPFNVTIKGVNYGLHDLVLRHYTASRSYQQRNAMTHLRRGELKPLIARRDLLDSTLRIYRRDTTPPLFALEIV